MAQDLISFCQSRVDGACLGHRGPDSRLSRLLRLDTSAVSGYTFGMKTAISLPEKVFREAERFARRVRKTRSRLYAEDIAEYLARHAPDDVTESQTSSNQASIV